MQWYSARTRQRTWQIVADIAAITTMLAAIFVAQTVRSSILALAEFGQQVQAAGTTFSNTMNGAADGISEVPLVGESLGEPFSEAGTAGDQLSAAGSAMVSGVTSLADAIGLALWLVPALFLVIVWLIPRTRFATKARATSGLLHVPGGRDLLALRALTSVSPAVLLRAVPDPLAAVRNHDDHRLDELAELALQAQGARRRDRGSLPAGTDGRQ